MASSPQLSHEMGLWTLADGFEQSHQIAQALKCLEAICQSPSPFLPLVEVKTRVRVASLLLKHANNVPVARAHLERAQILLHRIPQQVDLKLQLLNLLSRCHHLEGTMKSQRTVLKKALELCAATSPEDSQNILLWTSHFHLRTATMLMAQPDLAGALREIQAGRSSACKAESLQLQMLFATCEVQLLVVQHEPADAVSQSLAQCDGIWQAMSEEVRQGNRGLRMHYCYLSAIFHLSASNVAKAKPYVAEFDELTSPLRAAAAEPGSSVDQLLPPATGAGDSFCDWLPPQALLVLSDWLTVLSLRPAAKFKNVLLRLASGLEVCKQELTRMGVGPGVTERSLQMSLDFSQQDIWLLGLYLPLNLHLLENKLYAQLTRTELKDAQEIIGQAIDLIQRFPTITQSCHGVVHVMVGHYAGTLGLPREAAQHFAEGARRLEQPNCRVMATIHAALANICVGEPESVSKALDLLAPIQRQRDDAQAAGSTTYWGSSERAALVFAEGLHAFIRDGQGTDARLKLASGLKVAHGEVGNHQLVLQYLRLLGTIAKINKEHSNAVEILKSSQILCKALNDLPSHLSVLDQYVALAHEEGEAGEQQLATHMEYRQKKRADLQSRMAGVLASPLHKRILQFVAS